MPLGPDSRLMVFSAHAADFCSRSGGAVLRYVRAGALVSIVCVTSGARGESPSAWRRDAAATQASVEAIRLAEAREACARLGAGFTFLGYEDNPLEFSADRLMRVTILLREFRPAAVLTHWHKDPCNPDHETLARTVIQACHYCELPGVVPEVPALRRPPALYFFEPTVPTTPMTDFAPDTYIDITPVFEAKTHALKALATQADLPDLYRLYGEYRGHQARVLAGLQDCRFAEAYKRFYPFGGEHFV